VLDAAVARHFPERWIRAGGRWGRTFTCAL